MSELVPLQLRILFPTGLEELFIGDRILVQIGRSGVLVLTIEDGQRVTERAWPAGAWSEYIWEGKRAQAQS